MRRRLLRRVRWSNTLFNLRTRLSRLKHVFPKTNTLFGINILFFLKNCENTHNQRNRATVIAVQDTNKALLMYCWSCQRPELRQVPETPAYASGSDRRRRRPVTSNPKANQNSNNAPVSSNVPTAPNCTTNTGAAAVNKPPPTIGSKNSCL